MALKASKMFKYFWSIFVFIFLHFHHVFALVQDNYKMRIVSLTDCILPEDRYDKANIIKHAMTTYKLDRQNERIRANMSIMNKTGPVYLNMRSFEMVQSTFESFILDINQTCDDVYFSGLLKMLNVKMTDQCEMLPGVYTYEKININTISPLMGYIWKYGRYGSYMDFRTPKGTIACVKAIIQFYPVDITTKKKKNVDKRVGVSL